MNLFEIIRIGLVNLLLHPLRSLLTILGIVFGVAAVVAMLAISEGARWEAQQGIKQLGIENVRVFSQKPVVESKKKTNTGRRRFSILKYGLKFSEFEHLSKTLKFLKSSVPLRDLRKKVYWRDERAIVTAIGTTWKYLDVTNSNIQQGRFITQLDEKLGNRVCVVGAHARRALFSYRNPIGELINIGSKWYEVIGLMEMKSGAGEMVNVRDVNKDIYVPLQTAVGDFGVVSASTEIGSMEMVEIELDEMYFRMETSDYVEYAAATIENYLSRNHADKDMDIEIPKALLAQKEQTQQIWSIVMVSIASIALIVGGIGIMNIMLATVTERTREIGTRRAVGAQRMDILLQFLFETVLLAILGGMIGVLLGAGGAWAIVKFAGWKTIVSMYSVVLSFGISALVGMVFGMYPAIKAANLSPIDALRYE